MKANVPDKIYVQLPSRNWIGKTWNKTPIEEGDNPNWKNATNIEYIRKDTFIEKACEWLKKYADSYTWYNEFEGESGMIEDFIRDFRNAMKL